MAKLRFTAIILGTLLTLGNSSLAYAEDDLCGRLQTLEAGPLSTGTDGKAIRRWVEFWWWGDWMVGGSSGCRHSADQLSAATCKYLMENTSREFRAALPLRGLRCYGYRTPDFAQYDWADWTGAVRFRGKKADRQLAMDVDLAARKSPASTVRFSVIPNDPSKADVEPTPLTNADIPSDR